MVAPAVAGGVRVETIDAVVVEGKVVSISDKEVVILIKDERKVFQRPDIAEMVFDEAVDLMETRVAASGPATTLPSTRPASRPAVSTSPTTHYVTPPPAATSVPTSQPEAAMPAGACVVVTAAGDRLAADNLTVTDGKIRFQSRLAGAVVMAMNDASYIYQPCAGFSHNQVQQKVAELKLPASPMDMLIVARKEDNWVTAEGVLKGIDDSQITFQWNDADRTIPRRTVPAIRLAAVAGATSQPTRCGVLLGRDGSSLSVTKLALSGDSLEATSASLGQVSVRLDALAAIRFDSDRVVNLSEMPKAEVKEYGFFDTTFPHRTDRSAGGGQLKLGGRTFRTGLGLHSYCELTYKLDGQYSLLVATVGIDDSVRPAGDANLTFLADGKPVGEPLRLTGKAAPTAVRIPLKGAKELIIRVDFGDDKLDAGDHVDLAGARLVK